MNATLYACMYSVDSYIHELKYNDLSIRINIRDMFLVNYVPRNGKASWHRTNAGRANVHKKTFKMLYEAFSRGCVK